MHFKDNTLFLTHFPDNKDAQAIKQSGITKLVYLNYCSKCKKPHSDWKKNTKCKSCKGAISLLVFSDVKIKKYSDLKDKYTKTGSVKIDLKKYYAQSQTWLKFHEFVV
jgi:deoxycytidylate deaminase